MTKPDLPELATRLALRPKEAAAALGISERRLRELLPELPHVRRKGVLLFPLEGLRAWLASESSTEDVDANAAKSLADRVLEDLGR